MTNFYLDAMDEVFEESLAALMDLEEDEGPPVDKDALRQEFDAIWEGDPAMRETLLANYEQVHGPDEAVKQGLRRTTRLGRTQ